MRSAARYLLTADRVALPFAPGEWGRYGHVPVLERKTRRSKEIAALMQGMGHFARFAQAPLRSTAWNDTQSLY